MTELLPRALWRIPRQRALRDALQRALHRGALVTHPLSNALPACLTVHPGRASPTRALRRRLRQRLRQRAATSRPGRVSYSPARHLPLLWLTTLATVPAVTRAVAPPSTTPSATPSGPAEGHQLLPGPESSVKYYYSIVS